MRCRLLSPVGPFAGCCVVLVLLALGSVQVGGGLAAADPATSAVARFWQSGQKAAALEAIAKDKLREQRPLVEASLTSADAQEVALALRAWKAIVVPAPEDGALLTPLLGHADASVRLEAIQVIAARDDDAALPYLIQQAQNPEVSWREPFIAAVRSQIAAGLPGEPTAWPEWIRNLTQQAEQALAGAETILTGQDKAAAGRAIRDLVNHRHARHLIAPRLDALLDHQDPQLAGAAKMALTEMKGLAAHYALTRRTAVEAALADKARLAEEAAKIAAAEASRKAMLKWAVPLLILGTLLAIVLFLGRTPAGKKAVAGTVRFVKHQATKPGLAGATARIINRAGTAVHNGTKAFRRSTTGTSPAAKK